MLNKKRMIQTKTKKSKSFLLTLFNILNENKFNEIIHWNLGGNSIVIQDPEKLSEVVLPRYFLHNNYNSFTRQLNIYGFHKTRNVIKEDVDQEFKHEILNKNSSTDQLNQIVRRNKIAKLMLKYNKKKEKNFHSEEKNELFYNNRNDLINILLMKNQEEQINIKKDIDILRNENKVLKEQLYLIKEELEGHNIIINKKLEYYEQLSNKSK